MPSIQKRLPKSEQEQVRQIYQVLSPLRHDLDAYEHGDSIEMDGNEASELIAAGVIAPTGKSVVVEPNV